MPTQPDPGPPDDDQQRGPASPARRDRPPLLPIGHLVVAAVVVLILGHTGGGVRDLLALLGALTYAGAGGSNGEPHGRPERQPPT